MQIINYSDLQIKGITPKEQIFPDTEFKLVVENLPTDSVYVIIVKSDINPAQKIMATAMLINIVKQKNPEKIIVVHPWLSFARQDRRFLDGEPLSIEIVLDLYDSVGATDLISFDIHSVMYREPGVHAYKNLKIHNVNFVSNFYEPNYLVLSPTGTDEPFLKPLRDKGIPITYFKKEKFCLNCNKPLQLCTCGGAVKKSVRIVSDLDFTGKNILAIDDIIAGGGTMLATVEQLHDKGANEIVVCATHGFFNNLEKADTIIKHSAKVKVSNTVTLNSTLKNKVEIIDVIPTLTSYLKNF